MFTADQVEQTTAIVKRAAVVQPLRAMVSANLQLGYFYVENLFEQNVEHTQS